MENFWKQTRISIEADSSHFGSAVRRTAVKQSDLKALTLQTYIHELRMESFSECWSGDSNKFCCAFSRSLESRGRFITHRVERKNHDDDELFIDKISIVRVVVVNEIAKNLVSPG